MRAKVGECAVRGVCVQCEVRGGIEVLNSPAQKHMLKKGLRGFLLFLGKSAIMRYAEEAHENSPAIINISTFFFFYKVGL